MTKGLEALDKLEECAEGMKDLPMSNWIDLANSEAELDLKIMDWVEEIKFELFKGKQALLELKQIKKAEPSDALNCVGVLKEEGCIATLVQGKILETIRQYILKAQEQEKILEKREKTLEIIKKKCDFMPLSKIKNLSYDLYVRWFDLNHYDVKLLLTQQEFDLLKEVLKDEK